MSVATKGDLRTVIGRFALEGASDDLPADSVREWQREMGRVMPIVLSHRPRDVEHLLAYLDNLPKSNLVADGVRVVKTTVVTIGGGRTTDQIVAAAKPPLCSYVNPDITQKNMPSGAGRERVRVLEWFEFNRNPTTADTWDICEEPGYGYPMYEDGLRFQEQDPDAQRERSHILIPENPWCDADGVPCALYLWSDADDRKLGLSRCQAEQEWARDCVFARRRYLPALGVLGA